VAGVAQPSGTVTLVFTDIEGSMRLLSELGEAGYLQALSRHRECVRIAFTRYRGYEVDYEGDSFFYAFASARGAVQAVSEAISALESGPILIRVGVHSGEPGLDPPRYVGLDVHKAARIMAVGHGGQVLLSKSTVDLVADRFALRDLGEHWLKDMGAPERLFQLGNGEFPPLKSLNRTNLPLAALLSEDCWGRCSGATPPAHRLPDRANA
jgi:class 3 adenylate cyclase